MTLADYSRTELCVELHGGDVAAVLCELSQALERTGAVPDALATFHAAMNRHYLSDRDIFPGVACAVACTPSLARPVLAVGRCATPLMWRPNDAPVTLVFLVATPTTEARPALLAALTRLARSDGSLAELQAAHEAEGMLPVLERFAADESRMLLAPIGA